MKKSEFVAVVAEKAGLTKKDAEKAMDAVFETVGDVLASGDKLQVSGFGTFETRTRAARTGHNPRTARRSPSRRRPCRPSSRARRSRTRWTRSNVRLDKYLKVSRLIKRRTVANDACDAARITVNGKPAKASYQVKTGDVIEIAFGQRTMRVEVLNIAEHALKADAAAMYRELP